MRRFLEISGLVIFLEVMLTMSGCGTDENVTGTDPEARLGVLRVELPCIGSGSSTVNCAVPDADDESTTLNGDNGVTYEVTIRLRGLVEQKTYNEWTSKDGLWIEGGTPDGSTFNIFRLRVSSPEKTYYINAGSSYIDECFIVDYERTVVMDDGAVLALLADAGGDGLATKNLDSNGDPLVVPGVSPFPDPFNGQFVQIDVVSISVKE